LKYKNLDSAAQNPGILQFYLYKISRPTSRKKIGKKLCKRVDKIVKTHKFFFYKLLQLPMAGVHRTDIFPPAFLILQENQV
jgi:hypothetical protein